MSQCRFDWRNWPQAVPWIGLTAAGGIFLLVYVGRIQQVLTLVVFIPTTPLGIGGAIGALFGRAKRGALIALAAEFVFAYLTLMVSLSGLEDFRGILVALSGTAAFVWFALYAMRERPTSN